MNPLTALIISQPGMAERLLAEHVDDGAGKCAVCSVGARTPDRYRWPCSIRECASAALQECVNDGR